MLMNKKLFCGRKGTSNNTVVVLVAVALLVTIIGTWTVLSSLNSLTNFSPQQKVVNADNGKVLLNIIDTKLKSTESVGMVTLNIGRE